MGTAQTENVTTSPTTSSLAPCLRSNPTDLQQEPEPVMNMQLPMAGNLPVLQSNRPVAPRAADHSRMEKSLRSDDLLQGHKAVAIEHNGALYRLQSTKLGKLILTK